MLDFQETFFEPGTRSWLSACARVCVCVCVYLHGEVGGFLCEAADLGVGHGQAFLDALAEVAHTHVYVAGYKLQHWRQRRTRADTGGQDIQKYGF